MPQGQTGARLLVETLVSNGVDRAFLVPGESYLPVLDALHDASIPVTVCRQEGGAAMMADAAQSSPPFSSSPRDCASPGDQDVHPSVGTKSTLTTSASYVA